MSDEIIAPPAEELKLTKPIAKLIDTYVNFLIAPRQDETPLHVDEIASAVAKFYELVRKVVDWKDDNLLRRAAIQRILKRLLFSRLSGFTLAGHIHTDKISESLTLELIRGGHLPNDTVPREKIDRISTVLQKYMYFLEHSALNSPDPLVMKKRINYFTFLIELAACEIEETLTEPVLENGTLISMTEFMLEKTHIVPANAITRDEAFVQTYIAVCRTLFDLDNSFISFHLLIFQYPEWHNPSSAFVQQMNIQLPTIWSQIPSFLSLPIGKQFYIHSERIDTVFALLRDLLSSYKENPQVVRSLFTNKNELLTQIGSFYDKRYSTLKKRLTSLAIFSTLSVFASNWITFFFVEVPLARVFAEGFNFFTAVIDFLIPTIVMFLLVIIIRPPKPANRERVLRAVSNTVYLGGAHPYVEIRAHPPRRPLMRFLVVNVSLLITALVLGGIGWIFWIAGLPITSVVFDTFTIALTIFAAVTIRNKAQELNVGEPASMSEFLLDMISVPVANLGSLLANKWKEYNIVAFIFTFLVETPFTKVVDVIEQWSQFIKERRSELH